MKVQGPEPFFAVQVTPDGLGDAANESGFGSVTFDVLNTGNVTELFSAITCAGDIPEVTCTQPSPASVEVLARGSTAVTVDYEVSLTAT